MSFSRRRRSRGAPSRQPCPARGEGQEGSAPVVPSRPRQMSLEKMAIGL